MGGLRREVCECGLNTRNASALHIGACENPEAEAQRWSLALQLEDLGCGMISLRLSFLTCKMGCSLQALNEGEMKGYHSLMLPQA